MSGQCPKCTFDKWPCGRPDCADARADREAAAAARIKTSKAAVVRVMSVHTWESAEEITLKAPLDLLTVRWALGLLVADGKVQKTGVDGCANYRLNLATAGMP